MAEQEDKFESNAIPQIEDILSWWHELSEAASIEDELRKQDELAILSWYLAKESADAKMKYNVDAFIRNVNVDRQTQKFIEEKKLSKAKAEIDARLFTKELYEEYSNVHMMRPDDKTESADGDNGPHHHAVTENIFPGVNRKQVRDYAEGR